MAEAQATDVETIHPRLKAIHALLPYAVSLARNGQQEMADTLSRMSRGPVYCGSTWKHIGTYIILLFGKPATPLDSVIAFSSHHVPWRSNLVDEDTVTRWTATASAAQYTEEVGRSVVRVLFQIASVDSLRPYIPFDIWAWLKNPSLRGTFFEPSDGSSGGVVCHVRALGDIEILTSYFLLFWAVWNHIGDESRGFTEMQRSIREDFGGTRMGRHREDLIEQLDLVLTWLNKHFGPPCHNPEIILTMERYGELKRALTELDIPTRACPRLILFGLLTPVDTYRIPPDFRVHLASPVSIVSHLGNIAPPPLTNHEVFCTIINLY